MRRRWTTCAARALAGPVIRQLAAQPRTRFADQAAWQVHLDRLGIGTSQVSADPVQSSSAMMLASSSSVGMRCAGSARRLVQHKLDTFTDLHRNAQQRLRALIWWYYADLKAYCAAPTARRRSEMRARFARIF